MKIYANSSTIFHLSFNQTKMVWLVLSSKYMKISISWISSGQTQQERCQLLIWKWIPIKLNNLDPKVKEINKLIFHQFSSWSINRVLLNKTNKCFSKSLNKWTKINQQNKTLKCFGHIPRNNLKMHVKTLTKVISNLYQAKLTS